MFRDLSQGEPPALLEADICIAGAGAAGITIALQFAGSGHRVLLLEGGGREFDEASQAMYAGEILGRPYFPLDEARLRMFGGSTNHWGGMCRPLDASDFEQRSWVPNSGWPIGATDLLPYRDLAHDILDLKSTDYDPARLMPEGGLVPDFDPERLEPIVLRLSPPTNFAEKFNKDLKVADNLVVQLHANVVDLQLEDGHRKVAALVIKTPAMALVEVRARYFVLALGGIENPRLLLNADRQEPNGVGNQHDLVGRYFAEHPNKFGGEIVTFEGDELLEAVRRQQPEGAGRYQFGYGLATTLQAREQTLNLAFSLHRSPKPKISKGYLEYQRALNKWYRGDYGQVRDHLLNMLADFDGAAVDLYRSWTGSLETEVWAFLRCEQAPNPDSRVTLVEATDALGLRRVGLDWRLGTLEKHTMRVAMEQLALEMGRLEIGRVKMRDWLEGESPTIDAKISGGHHHMGTTRMAEIPGRGVVDPDGRVHGIDNLYIAGSSVFPAFGFANPTLTIVELSLRLADHLNGRLDPSAG